MKNIFLVFIGGGAGSIVRYGISVFATRAFATVFPVATFVSNLLSSIVLACIVLLYSQKQIESNTLSLLLIVGFCGGFSTFSSFSYETVVLIRNGQMAYAIANVLISVAVCIGLIFFIAKS